ncbi:MAG: electron transfer flavoprotein subunit beta/FixA family protein [Spirochaetes bacterium]|nr:electron transfer flavoprotein subunit beta/FixA family protein [Spirochaetota bacterium]
MKILVCLKQVPDPEANIEIDSTRGWICESDGIAYRMNLYDEYALEEAVLIRESLGDASVDVISVGSERAAAVLKKGIEKGATNGIHIILDRDRYRSPGLIARLIADYARDRGYDLILAGVMAEDDMQCQVGPLIASYLGLPCAVSVVREKIGDNRSEIDVDCELEGGVNETLILPLPCLLTIQSGINRPRYPSLSNVLRAKEQALTMLSAGTVLSGQVETVVSICYPESAVKGTIIKGTPEQKAEKLLDILHEKSLL